jgi:hypothetical protein
LVSCSDESIKVEYISIQTHIPFDLNSIATHPDGSYLIAGGDTWHKGIVGYSDDLVNWEYDSLSYNSFLDILVDDFEYEYSIGLDGRLTIIKDRNVIERPFLRRPQEEGEFDITIGRSISIFKERIFVVGGKSYNNGRIFSINSQYEIDTVHYFENQLNDIINVNNAYQIAVGYGSVLKYENEKWEYLDLVGDNFSAVHFYDENTGWIAGLDGSIQKTEDGGRTWAELVTTDKLLNNHESLNDIRFKDSKNGIAVGDGGVIIKTDDGGNSWKRILVDFDNDINKILHHDSKYILVADEGLIITLSS